MSTASSPRGFTLIEVLIAMGSVSVLAVGTASLLLMASGAIRSARLSTTATLLALQKIEQLSTMPGALVPGITQDYFSANGDAVAEASAALVRRSTIGPVAWPSGQLALLVEVFVIGAGRVADVATVVRTAGGA